MKVIQGYLTQTEKQAINAILQAGVKAAKVGRKKYQITQHGEVYTVQIEQNDRGLGFIGSELRQSINTHKFTL